MPPAKSPPWSLMIARGTPVLAILASNCRYTTSLSETMTGSNSIASIWARRSGKSSPGGGNCEARTPRISRHFSWPIWFEWSMIQTQSSPCSLGRVQVVMTQPQEPKAHGCEMRDGEVEPPVHIHLLHPCQGVARTSKRNPAEDPAQHEHDLHRAELMTGRNQLKCRVGSCGRPPAQRGGDCSARCRISALQFVEPPFQRSRLGPPSIARPSQIPQLRAKGFDPLLQLLVLLLPAVSALLEHPREYPPGAAIRSGFLWGGCCARRHVRLHPWKRAPSTSGESATDFRNFRKPNYRRKRRLFNTPPPHLGPLRQVRSLPARASAAYCDRLAWSKSSSSIAVCPHPSNAVRSTSGSCRRRARRAAERYSARASATM